MSLWGVLSGEKHVWLVEGAVAEHCVEDVAASFRQGNEGLIVGLTLRTFPVMVRAAVVRAWGVMGGCFMFASSSAGRVLG